MHSFLRGVLEHNVITLRGLKIVPNNLKVTWSVLFQCCYCLYLTLVDCSGVSSWFLFTLWTVRADLHFAVMYSSFSFHWNWTLVLNLMCWVQKMLNLKISSFWLETVTMSPNFFLLQMNLATIKLLSVCIVMLSLFQIIASELSVEELQQVCRNPRE